VAEGEIVASEECLDINLKKKNQNSEKVFVLTFLQKKTPSKIRILVSSIKLFHLSLLIGQ